MKIEEERRCTPIKSAKSVAALTPAVWFHQRCASLRLNMASPTNLACASLLPAILIIVLTGVMVVICRGRPPSVLGSCCGRLLLGSCGSLLVGSCCLMQFRVSSASTGSS